MNPVGSSSSSSLVARLVDPLPPLSILTPGPGTDFLLCHPCTCTPAQLFPVHFSFLSCFQLQAQFSPPAPAPPPSHLFLHFSFSSCSQIPIRTCTTTLILVFVHTSDFHPVPRSRHGFPHLQSVHLQPCHVTSHLLYHISTCTTSTLALYDIHLIVLCSDSGSRKRCPYLISPHLHQHHTCFHSPFTFSSCLQVQAKSSFTEGVSFISPKNVHFTRWPSL